jgi:LmbE family N-acetylglucosaminyl deacetylase
VGSWSLNIVGVGCAHNGLSHPHDANNMAAAFVRELEARGHSVRVATFTTGAAENLLNHPADLPLVQDSRTNHTT